MMRILLADDHTLFRSGLKRILEGEFPGLGITEVASLRELLGIIENTKWDLLILDISLGEENGLDALPKIKKIHPARPILVLSMYRETQIAAKALRGGANGYLTKDRAPNELFRAIEVVLGGKRYLDESVAGRMADELVAPHPPKPHEALSARELEVLLAIASGKTVSEIASELCLSVKTVSTYRCRLLEKMSLKTNAELMRYALSHDLVK